MGVRSWEPLECPLHLGMCGTYRRDASLAGRTATADVLINKHQFRAGTL
jgi:hypothetical protein